jgi:dephospho-CoA kinase
VLLAALTGNIASGKSEVAHILARLGATIIDADQLAREVVVPGTAALAAIVARWGPRLLRKDGTLDRAALRHIVFGDEVERDALNAIVHPEVARLRDRHVAEARARGDHVVVADIPLLFETGLEGEFDKVILVDAPERVRLDRLVRNRGLDPDEAQRMIDAQMPSAQKRRRADIVIDNDSTVDALRAAVERAWKDLVDSTV